MWCLGPFEVSSEEDVPSDPGEDAEWYQLNSTDDEVKFRISMNHTMSSMRDLQTIVQGRVITLIKHYGYNPSTCQREFKRRAYSIYLVALIGYENDSVKDPTDLERKCEYVVQIYFGSDELFARHIAPASIDENDLRLTKAGFLF